MFPIPKHQPHTPCVVFILSAAVCALCMCVQHPSASSNRSKPHHGLHGIPIYACDDDAQGAALSLLLPAAAQLLN